MDSGEWIKRFAYLLVKDMQYKDNAAFLHGLVIPCCACMYSFYACIVSDTFTLSYPHAFKS